MDQFLEPIFCGLNLLFVDFLNIWFGVFFVDWTIENVFKDVKKRFTWSVSWIIWLFGGRIKRTVKGSFTLMKIVFQITSTCSLQLNFSLKFAFLLSRFSILTFNLTRIWKSQSKSIQEAFKLLPNINLLINFHFHKKTDKRIMKSKGLSRR